MGQPGRGLCSPGSWGECTDLAAPSSVLRSALILAPLLQKDAAPEHGGVLPAACF